MVSGSPVQMVGLSVSGCTEMPAGVGLGDAAGVCHARAAGRVARGAFGEALGVVACVGGKAPEGHVGARQRGQLGDVLDGEAKAVVVLGADRDRDGDRDVEDRAR